MTIAAIEHIDVDEHGVARIVGTRTKVVQVVLDKLAYGWGAEEIHEQHPHLSLAAIHAAFAYYYDHQPELDAEIERRRKRADELRPQLEDPEVVRKLREAKARAKS